MKNIINKVKHFFSDEQGGEVAEWGVVVAIMVTIAVATYGTSLSGAITTSVTKITNAITAG
ncbi:MAG: Flp family type IVb pilin [Methylobacter sp.]